MGVFDDCILDNCASRHLVSDSKLLVESKLCSDEIAKAYGESLRLTMCGSVRLRVLADGVEKTVLLMVVYLAPCLAKNIVSYGKLDQKGFALTYDGERRTLT